VTGVSQFIDAIREAGMCPPDTLLPGKIYRFSDGTGRNKNGWAIIYTNPDGSAGGVFGDHKDTRQAWFSGNGGMDPERRKQLQKHIEIARRKADAERKQEQARAAIRAKKIWDNAKPANIEHPYLKAKKINPYSLKQSGKALVGAIYNTNRELVSLQFIYPNGTKRFLNGGQLKGCFSVIGNIHQGSGVYVCEGFATGATIHEATGKPVIIALNCGNLHPVCEAIKKMYPDIKLTIVADNDLHTEGNPGRTKAEAAAVAFGAYITIPDRAGDFNDLISRDGLSLEKVKSQLEGNIYKPGTTETKNEWEDPVYLDDHPLPEVTAGLVSGPLGEMAKAVSLATETPLELALSMGLATVSAAVQKKIKVMPEPGYFEPVNIWCLTALDSANRKSTVQRVMTNPLTKWEERQSYRLGLEYKQALSRRKSQEKRIDKLRTKYAGAKAEELQGIEAEIFAAEKCLEDVPPLPKIWSQDITPEHLGTVMAEQGERAAILSSEGGIFDTMAGRYSNAVPNLDIFLQGHAGDSVRVERGSREPVYMVDPALTMGLSPQPEVLKGLVDRPGFRGRGLLARFLYFIPKSNLGHRSLEQNPVPAAIEAAYDAMLFSLLDITVNEPYILNFAPDAYREWKLFQRAVELELRDGGKFEMIRDWAGKLPGAAIRLTGILHCALHYRKPWGRDIGLEIVTNALDLAAIYSEHALYAFNLMVGDQNLSNARKVWRWIERNRQPEFAKQEVYQGLKGSFPRAADLEEPLAILEERNYIWKNKSNTKGPGRKKEIFEVNPQLRWG